MALPDFPEVKGYVERQLFRVMRQRITDIEPLLREIRHNRIHEGSMMRLTRADTTTDHISLQSAYADMEIPRDEMRGTSVEQLLERIDLMARQFADQQAQLLIAKIGEAVDKSGNAVSAAVLGEKEAFLEMHRRIEVDFDAATLEPRDTAFIVHPSQVDALKAKLEEWEKDPDFQAEMERIHQQQLEAWRARENNRQLVD